MRLRSLGILFLASLLGGCGSSTSGSSPGLTPHDASTAEDGTTRALDSGSPIPDATARADARATDSSPPLPDAAKPVDAHASDAGSIDASVLVDAAPDSSFGHPMGDDPCVGAGVGSAWSMDGRCLARPGRSGVVSSQTGHVLGQTQVAWQEDGVFDSIVFSATGTGYVNWNGLNAFDPASRALDWSVEERDEGPFVGADGTLYFWGGINGEVTALTPGMSGATTKWTKAYVSGGSTFTEYDPPPVILPDGTLLLTPSGSGMSLKAVRGADGSDKWSVDLSATLGADAYTAQLVASSTGIVYVITAAGVAAVSETTQQIVWSSAFGAYSGALDEKANLLYTVSPDPGQGVTVNQTSQDGTWVISTIAADVGGTATTVATFSDGCSGDCTMQPLTLGTGGWVYVSGMNTFYAFQMGAPSAAWKLQGLGDTVSNAVVGADGTVYVASQDSAGDVVHAYTSDGHSRWKTKVAGAASEAGGSTLSIDGNGYLYALFEDSYSGSTLYQFGP